MPQRWELLGLMAAWTAVFHVWGTSTLGYVNTPSLFGWWFWVYSRGADRPDGSIDFSRLLNHDEAYAWFIPLVVVFLIWNRRDQVLALTRKGSWAGLAILGLGGLVHILGYMVQQSRISVLGYCLGLYGLTGVVWGAGWLRLTAFPFALFVFCVPIGTAGEALTVPLRLLATKVTAVVCHYGLGINVVQRGNLLFEPGGAYQYEVAAACSGIRSLTAIVAFSLIYGYLSFNTLWRRLILLGASVPLAVVANVFRLSLIVLAAEAFGQQAGDYVHESSWLSMAPYIPAIGGMLALGWWLSEERKSKRHQKLREPGEDVLLKGAEQKP